MIKKLLHRRLLEIDCPRNTIFAVRYIMPDSFLGRPVQCKHDWIAQSDCVRANSEMAQSRGQKQTR